jgi:hypothetical protein
MDLNLKSPLLLPTSTPERENSPELGSPSKIVQYNKKTGRPVRKSAGKVKKAAGYVDSSVLEEGPDYETSSSEESEDEDMEERGRTAKPKQKRKRTPSPPSPRLEPVIYSQEMDELTDDETGGASHRNTPKKPPITLQFNVPLGFHGPLFVKLDSAILKHSEDGVRHDMHRSKKARTAESPPEVAAVAVQSKSFTDLPPELRNTIYRHAFVRQDTLRIPQRPSHTGLSRSAQFLRTCRLVHNEGCSILYGENEFLFQRHHDTRAPFWEPKLREIGYQDVLQFLKMIGPENIQYLRDIQFDFDDALPKFAPESNIETRRYVVDEYLMNCLRILRDAKLRKVTLTFFGRRQLFKSDIRFLGYLEQIKADEVVKQSTSWHMQEKAGNWVWPGIKEQMTRKKKLYEKK